MVQLLIIIGIGLVYTAGYFCAYFRFAKRERKIFQALSDLTLEQLSCEECGIEDNECKRCFKSVLGEIGAIGWQVEDE